MNAPSLTRVIAPIRLRKRNRQSNGGANPTLRLVSTLTHNPSNAMPQPSPRGLMSYDKTNPNSRHSTLARKQHTVSFAVHRRERLAEQHDKCNPLLLDMARRFSIPVQQPQPRPRWLNQNNATQETNPPSLSQEARA